MRICLGKNLWKKALDLSPTHRILTLSKDSPAATFSSSLALKHTFYMSSYILNQRVQFLNLSFWSNFCPHRMAGLSGADNLWLLFWRRKIWGKFRGPSVLVSIFIQHVSIINSPNGFVDVTVDSSSKASVWSYCHKQLFWLRVVRSNLQKELMQSSDNSACDMDYGKPSKSKTPFLWQMSNLLFCDKWVSGFYFLKASLNPPLPICRIVAPQFRVV